MTQTEQQLSRSLSGVHLWGIAVGLVISGEYFGWSYGWADAGTLGFLVTTVLIAVMYTTFIFSYTELTTAIPHAGGPFAYGYRAFGPVGGYLAGYATLVEFVFAPPAIALAIGAYLHVQFQHLDARVAAVGAYAVFMTLNMIGVVIAATFELVITLLAIAELVVFMAVVAGGFSWAHYTHLGWAGHAHPTAGLVGGIFAAIPFAIWFFLAIEGAAMAAEEVKDPARTVPPAYIFGIITLLALAFGTMIFAGGAGNWRDIADINDPLPQAMRIVVGARSGWLRLLVWVGLLGLIASFHGIIMGYSRQIFALARAGYLPRCFGRIHHRWRTPYVAVLVGGVVGVAAIYSDRVITIAGQPLTASIVTLSALGAIVMYIVSLAGVFRLRRREPHLNRPFRTPLFPIFPSVALLLAVISLVSIVYYNPQLAVIFVALGALGGVVTFYRARHNPLGGDDGLLMAPKPEGGLAARDAQ
jgi:ethanolamine permease